MQETIEGYIDMVNMRSRRVSDASMPSNFARHFLDVASENPPLRQISAAAEPASVCFGNPMICSSVNLLFLMSAILLMGGLLLLQICTAAGEQVTSTTRASTTSTCPLSAATVGPPLRPRGCDVILFGAARAAVTSYHRLGSRAVREGAANAPARFLLADPVRLIDLGTICFAMSRTLENDICHAET